MTLETGLLVVKKSKGGTPRLQVLVGKTLFSPSLGEVSRSVLDRLSEVDGEEVEFERVAGQPKKVREVGGSFLSPQAAGQGARRDRRARTGGARPPRSHRRDGSRARARSQQPPDFHNPYNFVPAPPRRTGDPDLGDHRPVKQDAFACQRYTGRMRVRMIAKTPLLVPDTEMVTESDGHKTYPLRVGADGRPLIPASSVRGLLRCAYEAVTNSRFGRFDASHRKKLDYRQGHKPYARVPFEASPWSLLHETLLPAATMDQLSPADRVFGWVRADADRDGDRKPQGEGVAARGLLRVGPVRCESSAAEAVESFPSPGVPLAILSAPKPQQGRFYVAKTGNGEAQEDELKKVDAGYSAGKGLRGRKVYPHQRSLPGDHWANPAQDRTQRGVGRPARYQEYRRPQEAGQEQRDDQNRSILGWVKPGAELTFDLHVHNLSKVELGALLWLLTLPDQHFLRLGGGKPLGFGSVSLTMEDCDVRTGKDLRARYKEWNTKPPQSDPTEAAIRDFKAALCRAYPPPTPGGHFADIPFIKAFLVACRGFEDDLPIHYPRATEDGLPGPPSPDGESFKWFVANEKAGARYALNDLDEDQGLPTLVERSGRKPTGGDRRGRRGRP